MKISQLSILFAGILLMIVIGSDIKTRNLQAVSEARNDMDYYMDQAMESAADALMQTDMDTGLEVMDRDGAVDSFLSSMYSSLGILSDPLAQEKLKAYIPVVAVTDNDGYYLMYNDFYVGTDGYAYMSRRWTEKIPYAYEDDDFIYRLTLSDDIILYDKNKILDTTGANKVFETSTKDIRTASGYSSLRTAISGSFLLSDESFNEVRRQIIVSMMEQDMSWYVSKHNDIAKLFGITYRFVLPVSDTSDWNRALNGTGIIIMFQGMPLKESKDREYNRMAFSGSGVRKGNLYYVEQHGWYYIYHKEGCPLLSGNLNVRPEHYSSVEDCAKVGAFACELCDPGGVHAPAYEP